MIICQCCENVCYEDEVYYDKIKQEIIPVCLHCIKHDKDILYKLGYKKKRKTNKEATEPLTIRIKPSVHNKIQELFINTDWNDTKIINEILNYVISNKKIVNKIIGE